MAKLPAANNAEDDRWRQSSAAEEATLNRIHMECRWPWEAGSEVLQHMETYRPLMMCTDPTSAPHVFVDALVSYFSDQQLSTVGGMVIIAQAMGGRIYSLAPAMGLKGELRVELEGSRFVVVNDTTKQRTPLQYPSELVRTPGRLLVFNDFRDLVQAERERLTQTRKRLAGEVHSRNHGAENGHQDRS